LELGERCGELLDQAVAHLLSEQIVDLADK